MGGSRKFCQGRGGGPTLTFFVVVLYLTRGREDPNTTINRPSSARQQNAIKMSFRWRADDGPTLNAGMVALIFSGDPNQMITFANSLDSDQVQQNFRPDLHPSFLTLMLF